jgi:hypothetical protein
MMVSLVGRMISGSSSGLSGTSPFSPGTRREWVTTAHSIANPSTCSASLARKLTGMSSGK